MLRIIGITFIALTAASLSACSFQPLYGTTASGSKLTEELKSVSISKIPGRVGQRIRNELIYQVTNGGAPLPPLYRLELAVRESDTSTLVQRTGDAQGQIYRLDVAFKLIRLRDKKVIYKGSSYARAAYDKSFFKAQEKANPSDKTQYEQINPAYGGVRARINAENRASKSLAEEIKVRLAAYLSAAS
ncbi:MAG: hypothetical protein ACRBBN_18985 [Methyloligellaceae bacterium]